MDRLRVEPRSEQARCPYCHEVVAPVDEKAPCLTCMAWHHRACRDEHGSCAACGATEGAEKRRVPPPAPAPVAPGPVGERPPWLPPEQGWILRQAAGPPPAWRTDQERSAAPGPQPTPIGARAILYYFLVLLALAILVRVLGG